MTMQAMTAFLEKAQSDPALVEKLVGIVEENEGQAIYDKLAALACDSGYDVTAADTESMHQSILAELGDGEGDLSDDDLESVAGGLLSQGELRTGKNLVGAIRDGGVEGTAMGLYGGMRDSGKMIGDAAGKEFKKVGDFFSKW